MNYIDKILEDIENEDTSAAAGLPGFDMPHTKKKPIKNYQYHYQYEQDESNEDRKDERIMIDFDGVIHSYHKGWNGGEIYGYVLDNAKEIINELSSRYEIVIFTTRLSETMNNKFSRNVEDEKRKVEDWLSENGIYFDHITSEKLPAIAYIDDRSIEFKGSWDEVREKIKNMGDNTGERGY